MSIEPIIREQLFRDSGFELKFINKHLNFLVDILARVVNEYESIEGKGIVH